MEKLNLVELLRDCPTGMELDCASYDNVSFDKISDDKKALYPIFCYITDKEGNRSSISFTENGCESKRYGAKCVIFPKGKNTWKDFVPPCQFKDGDVVICAEPFQGYEPFIYREIDSEKYYGCYCGIHRSANSIYSEPSDNWADRTLTLRLANYDEKKRLIATLALFGYKWNAETKTLEKLIVPKFKVGDKVKDKNNREWFVAQVSKKHFSISSMPNGEGYFVPIDDQDDFSLVPNKFDITTLKAFDKVLYRMRNNDTWSAGFYNFYKINHHFVIGNAIIHQCIPYNDDTKHLLGTTNDCDEYYKTWEK